MADQPEDLYEGEAPSRPQPESKPEKDGEGEKTFLVPSEICPGMKPGEEMVVTIKAVHDDQYSIAYSPKKKESAEAPNEPDPEPMNPQSGSMYE